MPPMEQTANNMQDCNAHQQVKVKVTLVFTDRERIRLHWTESVIDAWLARGAVPAPTLQQFKGSCMAARNHQ